MKLKTKLMMALTVLAVACGHRGSKDVSTRTEEKIVLNGNFDQDVEELNQKGVKAEVNKDNGTVVMVEDHDKLYNAFYDWAKVNLNSEDDAAKVAERFKTEKVKFVAFKQAFDFAHTSENGPQLTLEESVAYADKVVEASAQKGEDGQFHIAENAKAFIKKDAEVVLSKLTTKLDEDTKAQTLSADGEETTAEEVTPEAKAEMKAKALKSVREEFKKEVFKTAE